MERAVVEYLDVKASARSDAGSTVRMDFGPGYRLYFGQEGQTLIVLLGGGTKARQSRDIADAKVRWADYKSRKRS